MTEDGDATTETEQWSRIQMTEPGEVNGVRYLAGTIIDAQTEDADKLIRSGKAVRVMRMAILSISKVMITDSNTPQYDANADQLTMRRYQRHSIMIYQILREQMMIPIADAPQEVTMMMPKPW